MLQLEVLIGEPVTVVDTSTASSLILLHQHLYVDVSKSVSTDVAAGKVTALKHEVRNDTMEPGTDVAFGLLPCTKNAKVLGSLRDDVIVKIKVDTASLDYKDIN